MDLVSAYRAVGGPQNAMQSGGIGAGGLNGAAKEAMGRLIPAGELEKLSSGVMKPSFTNLDGAGRLAPTLSMGGGPTAGRSFDGMLTQMVSDVSAKQSAANTAVVGAMTGGGVPLHQAMLSVEEASVSFQMMVEVRNRMLESYQELMRMQI